MNSRTKSALITLIIGLALNVALGAAKLTVGLISGSVSVASDAANNLSDAAVSVVSIVAVALAARGADHDHPYGHGRYEYIATFILGAVIAAVGIEVLRDGVDRAVHPVDVGFDTAVWVILGVSVGVKAFMAVFYRVRAAKQNADTVKAAAVDSMSDAIVTSVVLACALIERYTGVHIDGYVSIGLSVVILVFAFRILKRVISRLLGERPDAELVSKINGILDSSALAVSSHDLVINDYGEQNKIAEVDLVFPAKLTFVDVHAECDLLERRVAEETGVRLSIHADPLITDDDRLNELRKDIDGALKGFNASAHDLAINDHTKTVELDIRLPDDDAPEEEIKAIVTAIVKGVLPYDVAIDTDYN